MFRQLMRYGCAVTGFLVAIGLAAPRPAAAQGVDFAAGYSFLKDNESSENFGKGFFASLGVNTNSWLAIVGEVSSNWKTFDELGEDFKINVDFYGAGVRFSGRSGAARPYAQVLFGAARGRIEFAGEAESGSEFAWQPGAGVDAYFSRSVGVRFGVNGRFIHTEDVTGKEVQVIVGIVFGGRR
jgi:hypothetical protein